MPVPRQVNHTPLFSPRVRQFEAAGFRAWPAASVTYDGAWAVRLTASHPAKRLNSINPLDPGDDAHVEVRLARASARFRAYGRPLTVRVTPLTPASLSAHCDREGWSRLGASLVMAADISAIPLDEAIDQLPLRDMARYVDAAIAAGAIGPDQRAGLSEIVGAIEPAKGLFVREVDNTVATSLVCVQDGMLAGLFEVATQPQFRRYGFARSTLLSALKWAAQRGATKAWLQVEEANEPALTLYAQLGFCPVYRYDYRRPPEANGS